MITAEGLQRIDEIPALTHEQWMQIGEAQNDAYLDLLRDLSSEDWTAPTDCALWTVKDIAAHTLGQAEAFTSFAEYRRQTLGGLKRRSALGSFLNGMNQTQVDDRRHLSPDELIVQLDQKLPRFLELRRKLGRIGKVIPIYEPNLGPTNLRYLMGTIFARDVFMHRVDIARAVGRDVLLGAADRLLVADVVRDWVRRSGLRGRISLEGPGGGAFLAGSGSTQITGEPIQFCRVLSGRAEPDAVVILGDVEASSNRLKQGCPF